MLFIKNAENAGENMSEITKHNVVTESKNMPGHYAVARVFLVIGRALCGY